MEIKLNSIWEWKLARICYDKMWSFRCIKFFLENLDDKWHPYGILDRDINTLMSPEFMFTIEVAKELLIIVHSDKQLMQCSCLAMNGWSSYWTELWLHPVWMHIFFMLLTCKSLAVKACLWCPYTSEQFSTQFFHCCESCITSTF